MTSSPGFKRRSPSLGEVRELTARRFAEEPELTSEAQPTPTNFAKFRSNSSAKRPVVNHASRTESMTEPRSSAPTIFPDTGTGDTPGLNSWGGNASAKYSADNSRIRVRNCEVMLVIWNPLVKRKNRARPVYCISQQTTCYQRFMRIDQLGSHLLCARDRR